jgi:hypothetical protein
MLSAQQWLTTMKLLKNLLLVGLMMTLVPLQVVRVGFSIPNDEAVAAIVGDENIIRIR